MHSIREIFRIGHGPSSSHTMGPEKACLYMLNTYPDADKFIVTLFGSLAKTGKGHRTDYVIAQTLGDKLERIDWDTEKKDLAHPNTMRIDALKDGAVFASVTALSVGGGEIHIPGHERVQPRDVYKENTFDEIMAVCREKGLNLPGYVFMNEGRDLWDYLLDVWHQMEQTVLHGLHTQGVLPGGLNVKRRAVDLWKAGKRDRNLLKKEHLMISAMAYAACEENANGEMMVTAPTCGASGVLPAAIFYENYLFGVTDAEIVDMLAVAGLIGCVIKQNASVSGAECGCQAEIGSACAMTAGGLAYLHGLSADKVECAAEIALEHCLGLTCDPVGGLVQIPCIERNATAALRAYDAATLAEVVYDDRKISLDLAIRTMYETGKDLSACYRETADGGLARLYVKDFY